MSAASAPLTLPASATEKPAWSPEVAPAKDDESADCPSVETSIVLTVPPENGAVEIT